MKQARLASELQTSSLSARPTKCQHLWVSDGFNNKMLKYDLGGQLLYAWGTFGAQPGYLWGVHSFDTDSEGNLYTGEVFAGRAQKLRPRAGADPKFLVGELASPGSVPPE